MNKHWFFWFFPMLLLLPSKSWTQPFPQSYQLQTVKGQNLQEAIERLASDYQIDFSYAPDVLAKQQLEQAHFTALNIESLLRQLLTNQPIQYRILADNRILLRSINLQQQTFSPSSLSLSGRIVDASTGQPMMNVAIALDTLNLGALSDEQGQFSLILPVALQQRSLWIYHIGYKSKQMLVSGFKPQQVITLQSEPLSLHEVVVLEHLPAISAGLEDGSIRLQKQALGGTLASQVFGLDIFRQVQLLAGVSADNDLSTDIKIRGSNADETLIILDGMPLYKVDHFYGIFSALNSSYLEEAQLYKNALPIQYGGRTGGMLLLRSADEISKLGGTLDLNLLSAALKVNTPISPTLGLSLSGRGSHLNVASSKFFDWLGNGVENYTDITTLSARPDILSTQPDFGFSDWNAKLLFAPNSRHHFAFNFFHSNDHYLNSYYNNFSSRFNQERVTNEENFRDQQDWQNTGSSIQYKGQLADKWQLEADGFYSRYQFSGALSAEITRTFRLGSNRISLKNDQNNQVENAGYRVLLEKELASDRRLQMGSSLSYYRTDFTINSEVDTLLANQGQSFDAQLFSSYQWLILDRLRLSLGGRLNYYDQTGQFYFSPRITGNYRFDSGLNLKSSFSINYQFIREITHENRLGQSVDLVVLSDEERFPVGQSTNFMLGAGYQRGHWWVDLELYHKKLSNVIDHSSINPTFNGEAVRPGRRQNYRLFMGEGVVNGLDLSIGWDDFRRYGGQVSYTLSKATNRFDQIQDGAPVPSRDDRRHQLKWINTYKLGHFDLSGNFIYSSGKPYYDLRIIPQSQNNRQREFIRWLPSYQRLDLGVAYNFNIGSARAKLGASVFNVTNNDNVKYLQFIYSVSSELNNQATNTIIGSQTDLLDRTLNLSFGLEF